LASFVSPQVYSHYATGASRHFFSGVVPPGLPWIAVYWIFSALCLAMIALLVLAPFQKVARAEDEKPGAVKTHLELLRQPIVWLFFLGIFSYVGLEQGLANWMSQFLFSQHGFNPQTEGASAVSGFWGLMTVGCVLGLVLLKFFDSRKVLVGFSAATFLSLSCAIFGPREIALIAFPVCGFTMSVMWSIIFALALNSLERHHGTFSGILCTGIVGGALVPLAVGVLGDLFGLRASLCVLYIPLVFIFSIGLWARPRIQNQTFQKG
jgi:FHS family L-fucose permease-like MFS transporter